MDSRPDLLARQSRWLDHYRPELRIRETGSVVSVGDGIAWVAGLPSAAMPRMVGSMTRSMTNRLISSVTMGAGEYAPMPPVLGP